MANMLSVNNVPLAIVVGKWGNEVESDIEL